MAEPRVILAWTFGRLRIIAKHAMGEGWAWEPPAERPARLLLRWYASGLGFGPALVVGQVCVALLWRRAA